MKLYKDNKTKIFNPVSGRYVSTTGSIGRRLERMSDAEYNELRGGAGAGAGAGTQEGGVKIFSQDQAKIYNPKTKRMVAVAGTLGRKLLKMSNEEYEKLKGAQPEPKKPAPKKRSEALKKVIREEQAKTIVRGVRRADEIRERARQEQEVGDKLDELIEQEFGVEEEKEEAKEEAKEEVPRGHSIRDTARAVAAQEEIEEVIQENPEVTQIPRGRTIRDIARALARGDYFELDAIARAIPQPRPAFERSVTELVPFVDQPILERAETTETMPAVPDTRPVLERQITQLEQYEEPPIPSQEGANTLDILLNVADVLDEITEKLEEQEQEEKAAEMVTREVENNIRKERMAEMKRIKEELEKAEEIEEQVWNDANFDLYALEPVEDDTAEYKNSWEDAVDELNELVEEEFGVEESKEEAKEEGQVFDDLTTAMGQENMGEVKEEEKRQMTAEEAIEGLRRNLMNLEFLDSGRAPYQSASSVPDPHLDAFSHIAAESKK